MQKLFYYWNKAFEFSFFIVRYAEGQVSAWQSATLLPINCKFVRPVPARIEQPVSQSGNLLVVVPRTINALNQHGKEAVKTNIHMPVRVPPQAENTTSNALQ